MLATSLKIYISHPILALSAGLAQAYHVSDDQDKHK
jgi:hypothetical protein